MNKIKYEFDRDTVNMKKQGYQKTLKVCQYQAWFDKGTLSIMLQLCSVQHGQLLARSTTAVDTPLPKGPEDKCELLKFEPTKQSLAIRMLC